MSQVPHGRQQERTWLAWRRTSAAVLVLCLVVTRAATAEDALVASVPSLVLLGVVALLCVSFLRADRWTAVSAHDPDLWLLRDGRVPAAVAGVVVALALVVVLLVWS